MTVAAPRIIVCGGRDFDDSAALGLVLCAIGPSEIAQGGARGADFLAVLWAQSHRVQCTAFAAEWTRDGKKAGPLRNQRMLDAFRPDLVVAFMGGKGTADMCRRALKAGVPVLRVGRFPTAESLRDQLATLFRAPRVAGEVA